MSKYDYQEEDGDEDLDSAMGVFFGVYLFCMGLAIYKWLTTNG